MIVSIVLDEAQVEAVAAVLGEVKVVDIKSEPRFMVNLHHALRDVLARRANVHTTRVHLSDSPGAVETLCIRVP